MASRLAGLGLALFLMFLGGPAMAQPTPVNLASEQRMLSQRLVKAYCQVGLNVMPGLAATQIAATISRFEANLQTLQTAVDGSPRATTALDNLRKEWAGQRRAAAVAVSRDAALKLSRQAENVLLAAERLTRTLEDERRSAADPLINLAGRQRMLAQRIAKDYLLRSWGSESSALREELESSINEFVGGLAKLRARSNNNESLRHELEEISQQWEWLQAALSVEGADSYRVIVAESADSILESADRVTRLIEDQARR